MGKLKEAGTCPNCDTVSEEYCFNRRCPKCEAPNEEPASLLGLEKLEASSRPMFSDAEWGEIRAAAARGVTEYDIYKVLPEQQRGAWHAFLAELYAAN